MREGSIIKFLHALDCENIDTKGAWVQSTCPLSPYTHGGGEHEYNPKCELTAKYWYHRN